MSKYTMTLEEMVDLGIPIFNEDIETIVTGYLETGTDAYFTSEYWTNFKNKFYRKYKYKEIGFETEEMFYDYFIQVFEENIDEFKKFWHNYSITDITSNNNITKTNSLTTKNLPFTELDELDQSASYKEKASETQSGMVGVSQLEQLNNYVEKLKDLDNMFLDKFKVLFMNIY